MTANPLVYEVAEDRTYPGDWRVEAIDMESEGECYVTIFCGHDAETCAREYAAWKNDGGPKSKRQLLLEAINDPEILTIPLGGTTKAVSVPNWWDACFSVTTDTVN